MGEAWQMVGGMGGVGGPGTVLDLFFETSWVAVLEILTRAAELCLSLL